MCFSYLLLKHIIYLVYWFFLSGFSSTLLLNGRFFQLLTYKVGGYTPYRS